MMVGQMPYHAYPSVATPMMCVCVCVRVSMSVCVFMHVCVHGYLSLIYFADIQFMYQILLLQVKVSVGLLSTLITDQWHTLNY